MAQLTNYGEKLLLDWFMTNGAATRPTSWYVGLFTSAPGEAGGGTEVSGSGYSRKSVTFAAASSPGGTTDNTNLLNFTASGGDWGTITHSAIFDAASGGNMLWYGPVVQSKTIFDGDTFSYPIGSIDLTLA